jgi:hypothetical protein
MSNPIAVFYGHIDDEDKMNVGVQDALVFQDKSKEGLEFIEITGTEPPVYQAGCSATHPAELPRDRHYTKPRRHLF